MKRIIILIITIASFALDGIAMPGIDPWKVPSIFLPDAYNMAIDVLGPSANGLHCISATLQRTMSAEGEWLFIFCSTNRSTFVVVPLNRTIKPKVVDHIDTGQRGNTPNQSLERTPLGSTVYMGMPSMVSLSSRGWKEEL